MSAVATRGRPWVDLVRGSLAVAVVLVVLTVAVDLIGTRVFLRAAQDPLRSADAVLVLGGEHDGREDYGIGLARAGWARTVVLSDPYPRDDATMRRVCDTPQGVEVVCLRPWPVTTQGEALVTRRFAEQRGWRTLMVVSWRFHLPRARLIFERCFSDRPGALIMRAVPRSYDNSLAAHMAIITYQVGALVKVLVQQDCA